MRQLVLSPRWIVWHLLTLGAMASCGWLAAWQWQRAGSAMGSALNVGYGLQWPVFAVFFGAMWWRMLRMEAARSVDGDPEIAATEPPPRSIITRPARPSGPTPFGPRPASAPPTAEPDDPELAEYNRMLARLAARPQD